MQFAAKSLSSKLVLERQKETSPSFPRNCNKRKAKKNVLALQSHNNRW